MCLDDGRVVSNFVSQLMAAIWGVWKKGTTSTCNMLHLKDLLINIYIKQYPHKLFEGPFECNFIRHSSFGWVIETIFSLG
ncbi:hypothetical protein Hanom_Chr14g01308771 [Helianthus anomalus]